MSKNFQDGPMVVQYKGGRVVGFTDLRTVTRPDPDNMYSLRARVEANPHRQAFMRQKATERLESGHHKRKFCEGLREFFFAESAIDILENIRKKFNTGGYND